MGFALSRDLCYLSFFVAAAEFRLGSLRGRRLKGKGKGVLGARETREVPFLLARPSHFPRAPNPLSLPFQTPATQATVRFRSMLDRIS